jgi:hypothetical protein
MIVELGIARVRVLQQRVRLLELLVLSRQLDLVVVQLLDQSERVGALVLGQLLCQLRPALSLSLSLSLSLLADSCRYPAYRSCKHPRQIVEGELRADCAQDPHRLFTLC